MTLFKEKFEEFYIGVVSKGIYYVPVILLSVIAYGYSIFNRTLSIDDIAQELYYGDEIIKIRSTRWGQQLINRLFSTIKLTPSINRLLGVIFLILTSILICFILYTLLNERRIYLYTIFSCLFITYPLINEFFEYYEALTIPVDFLIVSFVVAYLLINLKNNFKEIFVCSLLLSIVASGYESLLFVYVSLVMFVIMIQYVFDKDENRRNWILEGFRYAIPFFASIALRFLIGYILIFIYNTTYETNGKISINWLTSDFITCIKLLLNNAWYYGVRGLSYMPIAEFVIAVLLFIYVCFKETKNKKNIIIIILYLVSLFSLAILKADRLEYRMSQTILLFVALSFFIFIRCIKVDVIRIIAVVLIGFLSLRQGIYLNQLLSLNNQRSQNEINVISEIGYRLYSEYDLNKKVIFCGEYKLGNNIEEQICVDDSSFAGKVETILREKFGHTEKLKYNEYVLTDVNSVINWAIKSFKSQRLMKYMLSYCGYDVEVINDAGDIGMDSLLIEYNKIAECANMKPLEIREFDDYIIVYFGPISENVVESN